ncbi:hypothetical protein C8R44DRAFT_611076, partial [Mycena epipterygia]
PTLLVGTLTLMIHRLCASRAAQRDRAPQDVIHNLPWRVWTGSSWEKHNSAEIHTRRKRRRAQKRTPPQTASPPTPRWTRMLHPH